MSESTPVACYVMQQRGIGNKRKVTATPVAFKTMSAPPAPTNRSNRKSNRKKKRIITKKSSTINKKSVKRKSVSGTGRATRQTLKAPIFPKHGEQSTKKRN
jgi:hypothetical protein